MSRATKTAAWLLLAACVSASAARAQTPTDGITPLGMTPGAPAGSYPLSGFESVNYFNGGLNFALPLVEVAGRGDARMTVVLPIEQKWSVRLDGNVWRPILNDWTELRPGRSPGVVLGRGVAMDVVPCAPGNGATFTALTRFTFVAPDGTEHELRDTQLEGEAIHVVCQPGGASRGTTFVSTDGSAMTFVSDYVIVDGYQSEGYSAHTFAPNGRLSFRDGTEYRVIGGQVTEIRDRNGNRITIEYESLPPQRVRRIVDSLRREITFVYDPDDAWEQIAFRGFGGAERTITIEYAPLADTFPPDQNYCADPPLRCAWTTEELFPEVIDGPPVLVNQRVASRVVLPNDEAYAFQYNPYGELEQVFLPTGGRYRYTWGGGLEGGPASGYVFIGAHRIYRRVLQREVYRGADDDTLELVTTIGRAEGTGLPGDRVDVEHLGGEGALVRREEHFFHGQATISMIADGLQYPGYREGRERQTRIFGGDGTLLQTTTDTWEQRPPGVPWWTGPGESEPPLDVRLTTRRTTLGPAGPWRLEHYAYDAFNNRTEVAEYDFEADLTSPPARRRLTQYLVTNPVNGADYTGVGVHIRSLPLMERTLDKTGAERSRTTYEYDNYTSDPNHASLTAAPGAAGHATGFGTGKLTRGNLTGTNRHWDHDPGPNPTGEVWTYRQYDVLGNVLWSKDANGNVTTTSFDDVFGGPDGNATQHTPPPELAGQKAWAFPTWVTNPKQHSSHIQYDYNLGRPVDWRDPNGVVSSAAYDDPLDRPTEQIVARAGPPGATNAMAGTRFAYDDGPNTRITTTRDKDQFSDARLKTVLRYDGLGRPLQTRTHETASVFVFADTQYDALGRVRRVFNPLRSNALPPEPWPSTEITYDGLGRVLNVRTPDGASEVTAYAGKDTTVTDQAGKIRRSTADALGRVVSIVEDPGGLNYTTTYDYDVGDQVKRVVQGPQTRTFAYDTLGRLFQVTNPESGTVSYTHWKGGEVRTRQDARGIVTNYSYDPLNRLDDKSYSDGTPAVDYVYDELGSATIPFSIGRLLQVGSSASTTRYGELDALGRVKQSRQTTGTETYDFSYGYDLAGHLRSQTYPSGRVVTFVYDDAERPAGASAGVTAYASNIVYAPHGGVADLELGNGLFERTSFNLRLQPKLIALRSATADVFRLDYGNYGGIANNGNVLSQTIYHQAAGVTWSQAFTYDGANRLATVSEAAAAGAGWSQTYGYDRYGNRWVPASGLPLSPLTPTGSSDFNDLTNRLKAPNLYDLAGNHTEDKLGRDFTYDAESRQTTFADGSGPATYVYDGEGRRVKSIVQGAKTTYVYDAFGQLAGQYGRASSDQQSGVHYLTKDHLGSTRLVTNASASVIARHDYLPFGEELGPSVNGRGALYAGTDTLRHLFTGKERDAESALDYFGARYYGAGGGRFTTTDPIFTWKGNVVDPQAWNRYAYVRNNPLRYVDPDGRCSAPAGTGGSRIGFCVESFIAARSIGVFGFGDNRGHDAHDPQLTAKAEFRFTYDVTSGTIAQESARPGRSRVGIPPLGLGYGPLGSVKHSFSKPAKGEDGITRFTLTYQATNGFGVWFDAIDASITFRAGADGSVGLDLDSSSADDYPSLGVYSYRMIEGVDVATYLYEGGETTNSALAGPMRSLRERGEEERKRPLRERKEEERFQ